MKENIKYSWDKFKDWFTKTFSQILDKLDFSKPKEGEELPSETDPVGISEITQPATRRATSLGLIAVLIFFGIFGAWSVFATIESAAIAQGYVFVQGERKDIQHLEGGIVKTIFVAEGEHVTAGQDLMKLEDTKSKASRDVLRGQLNELLAEEARLIAERDQSSEITWPQDLLDQKDDLKVQELIKSQTDIFNADRSTLTSQLNILNQQKIELNKQIESLKAQIESETKQLELINIEIKDVAYLEQRKLIEKPRLLALQREAARLIGDKGEHTGKIAEAEQKIGETEQQIITVKNKYREDILTHLREAQAKLADTKQNFIAAQDVLNRTLIKAPVSGTVYGMTQHTIGGVITPGSTMLQIVPDTGNLIIEARLSVNDIDVVHTGLTAYVRLTAYKVRHTPVFQGKVTYVSADRFVDEKSQIPYFKAYVKIDSKEFNIFRAYKLYPGMPVSVMIATGRRSPFDYFARPILDSFWSAFREK